MHGADVLSLKCSQERLFTAAADGAVKIWGISDRRVLRIPEHKQCTEVYLELDHSSFFVLSSERVLRRYRLGSFLLLCEMNLTADRLDGPLFLKA
jgi:hypothetical protein